MGFGEGAIRNSRRPTTDTTCSSRNDKNIHATSHAGLEHWNPFQIRIDPSP